MPTVSVKSGPLSSSVDIHYETTGTGRPVVLIHGWPLSGAAWKDNVPALEQAGYQVVTYDRRGFGESEKPSSGYDYNQLADDLAELLDELDLRDVTLVGFSMGGGEVARYIARHGQDRLRSVVLAAAVPPYMMQTDDNPDGPLEQAAAEQMAKTLESDREGFFDQFTTQFFSAGDELKVSEQQRQDAIALCRQSDQTAVLACMESFGGTDFRDDLTKVSVPTLVIHGDSDGIVPFEGSGKRTHAAITGSELVVVQGAPHGLNVSHRDEFDRALLAFLAR
ncbi:MAG: alpha/beta hydrolase [Actinomycetota bacterium]|nr:alpha/beta hydrolase [Actinomycetota bacterium]